MDPDTILWLEFTKTGSPVKFKKIYNRFFRIAKLNAYRILQDSEFAEDIVQEVFYLLFKRREHYGHIRNFHAYLNKIIYFLCMKYVQRPEISLEEIDVNKDLETWEKDDNYFKDLLFEGIERLEKKNHKYIILASLDGKDNLHIANQIEKSEKYVRDTKSSAIKELKRILLGD